jgi:hypothetical protein
MGTISLLDKRSENVATLFRHIAEDAEAGKISGAIVICEYEDNYTLDLPGVFSQYPEDIVQVVGRLSLAQHIFSTMFAAPEE